MSFKNLFGGGATAETARGGQRTTLQGPRVPRHSSGWVALQQFLDANPGQRILDVGPTSPTNINFLTGLGHSVYMADMVDDANSEEYRLAPSDTEEDDEPQRYDTARFVAENLNFAGRDFDVVLLWDTLDYLPEPFVAPVIVRLHKVLQPGGRLLAYFHNGEQGPETPFCRYHLAAGESVDAQRGAPHRIHSIYSNRAVEKLFVEFRATRFFLARDKMREVLVER
jgi:SAM-dependent methyltransferase